MLHFDYTVFESRAVNTTDIGGGLTDCAPVAAVSAQNSKRHAEIRPDEIKTGLVGFGPESQVFLERAAHADSKAITTSAEDLKTRTPPVAGDFHHATGRLRMRSVPSCGAWRSGL